MKFCEAAPAVHNDGTASSIMTRLLFLHLGLSNMVTLLLLLLLLLGLACFRYSANSDRFQTYEKPDGTKATPLSFPYFSPLGSLPITYLLQPRQFVLNPK